MHRYVAYFWPPQNSECQQRASGIERALESAGQCWTVAYRGPGAVVAECRSANETEGCYLLTDGLGVVVGTLFDRICTDNTVRQRVAFDSAASKKLADTRGVFLIERYWGRYFSVIRDATAGTYHVLRDPTAQMTCLRTEWNGVSVFFSHVDDCVNFVRCPLSVDTAQLVAHMLSNFKVTRKTALKEIEDVPGGERQTVGVATATRTALWHPARFAKEGVIEDAAEAARLLSSTVQTSVDAWAACHRNILHCLSGGLDSSIVAACLARAPSRPRVTCFNIFVGATERDRPLTFPNIEKRYLNKLHRVATHGDERRFARLVAEKWKMPLIEEERRLERCDLRVVQNAPLAVSPSRYVQMFDQDALEQSLVKRLDATAVFNGQGGDELLYATSMSVGAVDFVHRHGFSRGFGSALRSASAISRESLWLILSECVKYGIFGRRMPYWYDQLGAPNLLTGEAAGCITTASVEHPWEAYARDLEPGKRFHVEGISGSGLYYHHTFERERDAVSVFCLLSQPIVELCLRMPTYVLLRGGLSRGLARKAFVDELPPEVRTRTAKGFTYSYANQLVRENISPIRDWLLGGELAALGILDRKRLSDYLTVEQTFVSVSSTMILLYLSAEFWFRQWKPVLRQCREAEGRAA